MDFETANCNHSDRGDSCNDEYYNDDEGFITFPGVTRLEQTEQIRELQTVIRDK